MKIASQFLLSIALLSIPYAIYCSAPYKYGSVSTKEDKEDEEVYVPANPSAASQPTMQTIIYNINAFNTNAAHTDTELKDTAKKYFSEVILSETRKIKNPHPMNIQKTIKAASKQLKDAQDLKRKFVARYKSLTAKRSAEQDIDEESIEKDATERFDSSADLAGEDVENQLIPKKCTIL